MKESKVKVLSQGDPPPIVISEKGLLLLLICPVLLKLFLKVGRGKALGTINFLEI